MPDRFASQPAQYVAFLRAINVGGHTVKMDRLRQLFAGLGFAGVETFIASGNVIFEAPSADIPTLERTIAAHLASALGYEVATFVRTMSELAAIAQAAPFPQAALEAAAAFNIAFLAAPLDADTASRVMALTTDIDTFHIDGREVYWLCRTRQSDSTLSNAVLEKTTGRPSTMRGANTIRRFAARVATSD